MSLMKRRTISADEVEQISKDVHALNPPLFVSSFSDLRRMCFNETEEAIENLYRELRQTGQMKIDRCNKIDQATVLLERHGSSGLVLLVQHL
jgi:hypothetical protein